MLFHICDYSPGIGAYNRSARACFTASIPAEEDLQKR